MLVLTKFVLTSCEKSVFVKTVVVLRLNEESEFATSKNVETFDDCMFWVEIDVPNKLFAKSRLVEIETVETVFAVIRLVDIELVERFDVLKLLPNIELTYKIPALKLLTLIKLVFTVLITFRFDTSDVPNGSGKANVFSIPQLLLFRDVRVTKP